jgi:hypothetical protein
MKITVQTGDLDKEAFGNRQKISKPETTGRRTMEIHWAESEFFEVWLKLARQGQERNRN